MEETEKLSLKKKPKAKPTFPKNEGKKDQNSFRNILPNIVHQLVIFVQKKSKSKKMVESILSKSEVD